MAAVVRRRDRVWDTAVEVVVEAPPEPAMVAVSRRARGLAAVKPMAMIVGVVAVGVDVAGVAGAGPVGRPGLRGPVEHRVATRNQERPGNRVSKVGIPPTAGMRGTIGVIGGREPSRPGLGKGEGLRNARRGVKRGIVNPADRLSVDLSFPLRLPGKPDGSCAGFCTAPWLWVLVSEAWPRGFFVGTRVGQDKGT